jgi:hypothetical protein
MAEVKQADSMAGEQAQAAVIEKRRRVAAGSRTVYTNPLGISGQASVARKTLLGQ